MKYVAEIDVMPLKALLDPQGKAVTATMKNIGLATITEVRIGKHITLEVEAGNQDEATRQVESACQKLLANPIMESFTFDIREA
ncbi:MAG: phosphoribosylformylglycinamidine synthase subunit PurS [Flavobacteriales bacterium]|nr:phosphoribosylformylglycinamidine synthase subunit PurS [Flavobacteriales bacterium]MCB9449101.1 phosphoribosylformylglycinamidine synthase subunit PurS [Flavobacteriales bacterium]